MTTFPTHTINSLKIGLKIFCGFIGHLSIKSNIFQVESPSGFLPEVFLREGGGGQEGGRKRSKHRLAGSRGQGPRGCFSLKSQ